MDLIELAQDMDRWPALPYTEMNLTNKFTFMCTQE